MRAYELLEGVDDPHIFKAIIMAGPPGAGKTFVANKLTAGSGLKHVDSDAFLKIGISSHKRRAELSTKQLDNYLEGRLGVIIDGTGQNVSRIVQTKRQLDFHGYETLLVFVDVELSDAQTRNQDITRDRIEDPKYVSKMWQEMQNRKEDLSSLFREKMVVINNRPEVTNDWNRGWKTVKRWLDKPVNTPYAQDWKREEQRKKSIGKDYKRLKENSTKQFREWKTLGDLDDNMDVEPFFRDIRPEIFFTEDFDDELLQDTINPWVVDVKHPKYSVAVMYSAPVNQLMIDISNYDLKRDNISPTIERKNLAYLYFDDPTELKAFIVLIKSQFDGAYNVKIIDNRNSFNEDFEKGVNPIAIKNDEEDRIIAYIQKNCSQYLNIIDSTQHQLFRGMKLRNNFNAIEIPGTRKDRQSIDMPTDLHRQFSEIIKKKGLIANRNNSWFGTGDVDQADYYGIVYVAFPTDGFHYTWSPKINDLYGHISDYHYGDDRQETLKAMEEAKQIAEDSYQGDDGSLVKAIESGHEIMFTSPKVILVEESFYSNSVRDLL